MMLTHSQNQPFTTYLRDLRADSLHAIATLTAGAAWIALAWSLWPVADSARLVRLQARPSILLLLALAFIAYALRTRVVIGAVLLISCFVGVIINISVIFHTVAGIYLLVIPIIFTSILLGQRAVILVTTLCAAVALAALPGWINTPLNTVILPTATLGMVAAATIIATRNLYTALFWSLNSYSQALANQQAARERGAELAQALKSLDVAAQNLHRANYALQIAQKRAEEARQIKQQFAQTISHELRTPLNLIIGFTESMIKSPETYGAPLPPRYLHDLDIVYRNANHLQNLVNDILDLARIEAAQFTLQLEPVNLSLFLEEVISMASSMAKSHQLDFRQHIAANLPDILIMDDVRIKQVLFNLLSNAVRFTPQGYVALHVERQSDTVVFSVEDSGIGIAEHDIETIFEPFRQLENPMRRRVGGAGLGLSISRQLITMHGGQINVRSQPGNGSTFTFTIPLRALPDGSRPAVDHSREIPLREENVVLLITSSLTASSLVVRHLEHHRAVVVRSVEQAHMLAPQLLPQAVILDTHTIGYPQPALESLAASWPDMQTLFIGCPLPNETVLSAQLDVHSYLLKPVSRETLWDTLRQFGTDIENILVVDDDRDFVRLMERMLNGALCRYQVATAYSGLEALSIMERWTPDLILLDLDMPDMPGSEFAARIRSDSRWRDVHIVIVSAQDALLSTGDLNTPLQIIRRPHTTPNDIIHWLQRLLE